MHRTMSGFLASVSLQGREDEVRERLDRILSSRDFVQSDKTGGLLDSIAEYIKHLVEWIKEKIDALQLTPNKFSIPGRSVSPEEAFLLKIIGIFILILFVSVILFFLIRNLRWSKKLMEKEDAELLSTLKDADEVEQRALQYSMKGDYRQGLRFLYISLLLKLNESNVIRIDKSKTNKQYLIEVINSGFGMHRDFREFTQAFNEFWYGSKPIDSTVFDGWHERYSLLVKEGKA